MEYELHSGLWRLRSQSGAPNIEHRQHVEHTELVMSVSKSRKGLQLKEYFGGTCVLLAFIHTLSSSIGLGRPNHGYDEIPS